jgi:transcriptional regulator with XRE-family HTH domain
MAQALCPAGQALKRWLDAADINFTAFADLIGASRQSLWRWMTGVGAPTIDSAARIEVWTGIPARMWASSDHLRRGSVIDVAA